MDKKTILVVGAHMDDCEIGAGGLIIKAVRKGHRVVLVNAATDYSTWAVTKGREEEIKAKVLRKAKEMKVEKKLLGYGYQSVIFNLESLRKMSEIILEVRPDIILSHSRLERVPSDHAVVGEITEHAVHSANALLGGKHISYGGEMYSYEVYPKFPFQPDTYIDISDVIKETVENVDYFGREIYAGSPHARSSAIIQSEININYLDNEKISLWYYGETKLALSLYRGTQCGARFAEAYIAINKKVLGERLLQEIIKR